MLRPWFLRAVDASPLTPIATAACVAALLLVANLSVFEGEGLDLLLYFPLAIGYLLAASALCREAGVRDLRGLRPSLSCSGSEYAALEACVGRYPPSLLWGASLAGLAMHAVLAVAAGPLGLEVAPWSALLLLESLTFWILALSVMAMLVADALRLRRAGTRWLEVRLFEPERLSPFRRAGLRGALVILGVFGLRAAFYAVDAPWRLVVANLLPMSLTLLLATTALLLPSLGARRRIRDTKRRELARVAEALARQPTPGVSRATGTPRAYLDLLEYRERLQNVREWPLDAPSFSRFLFYLLIPVGGWIGGALMERLVSRLLD